MRSPEEVARVLELSAEGRTVVAIAQVMGIPRSTVRDWVTRQPDQTVGGDMPQCVRCSAPEHDFSALPAAYAYLLGLYLGDGCISAHPRGVFRLRVYLDLRYPEIVDSCEHAMGAVLPGNRISRRHRASNYVTSTRDSNVEVSVYSKSLPCLFPQHGPGRKHDRRIQLTDWQRELVSRDPEQLLRGLIHSDGCRFINTGRNGWRCPRYSFHNLSEDIKTIFCEACEMLDLHWTRSGRMTIYVSRKADVERLDEFIGAKR